MTITKETLSASIDAWGAIEDISTAIVLIGVIGEFVAELTGRIKSARWRHRIATWSTLAVILGISGELASQHRLSAFNGTLQTMIQQETADAQRETELLRSENLTLQKEVTGRVITDEQRKSVIAALKGKITEDVAVYMVHDPEARMFGYAIAALMQDVGSVGRISFVPDPPPEQTGVEFCGDGSRDSLLIGKVLADQKLVGLWGQGCIPENNSEGCLLLEKYRRLYCPAGSIFVGLRNPLNLLPPGGRRFVLMKP